MSLGKLALILDTLAFWLSFGLVAHWRWHLLIGDQLFWEHLLPFSFLFFLSLLFFYSMRLYEDSLNENWFIAELIGLFNSFLAATGFFYFYSRIIPTITPRGSLILFWFLFGLFSFKLKILLLAPLASKTKPTFGLIQNPKNTLIHSSLIHASQFYQFSLWEIPVTLLENQKLLAETVRNRGIKTVLGFSEDLNFTQLKSLSSLNLEFLSLETFFEKKLRRLNLELTEKTWLLNSLKKQSFLREGTERVLALLLLFLTSPLWLLIVFLEKILSPGRVLFKQKRVGKNGKIFELYKFRTMIEEAEKTGAQWATPNDPRVTPLGRFLRQTHLDELPQLINILKGEMSFIGPRPERPEFVKELEEKIPFYSFRHLIKPGLTGWAQINYPYGASLEDAKNKLEFDLYYLKNRSLFLDLEILIKTFHFFFINFSRS